MKLSKDNINGLFGAFVLNSRESAKKYFLFSFKNSANKNEVKGWHATTYTVELNVKISGEKLKKSKRI